MAYDDTKFKTIVCAVVKGDIETPNDISGVVDVGMDTGTISGKSN